MIISGMTTLLICLVVYMTTAMMMSTKRERPISRPFFIDRAFIPKKHTKTYVQVARPANPVKR